ncbi:MAG: leucine-rich repeat domain-containing protein [Clostridia bacterium]|nr:leucine-rich repeat domain-containing protein [Clostridia bacterium]
MTALFERILNMSIAGGIVVLAVVLARLALKRAPKWTRLVLWGVVGLRLALPFFVESPVGLMPRAAEVDLGSVRAETTVKKGNAPAFTAAPYTSEQAHSSMIPWAPAEVSSAPALTETPASSTAPAARTEPKKSFDWIGFAACAWAAGAAVMAAYAVISRIVIGKKLATAVRSEGNVYEADSVKTPFLLGIFAPKIYLPFGMDPRSRKMVLMHERAHLKNLDHIIKPVGWALLSLHWFNPLVWLAFALFSKDVELACDERVVKRLDKNERADYSKTLLELSQHRIRISACPLAFGESNIKERVKNVLNYKKPALWVIIAAVLAALAVAVCLLTSPKKKDRSEPAAEAPTASPTAFPTPSPAASPEPTPAAVPPAASYFADPYFEQQVRQSMKLDPDEEITADMLKKVSCLWISGAELTDLSGLRDFKNLEALYISFAPNADLSVLKEMIKVTDLSLKGCGITDISFISGLHRLNTLDLSCNRITDVSPLTELRSLTNLDLTSNCITDISALGSLPQLHFLDVSWNDVDETQLEELTEKINSREDAEEYGSAVYHYPYPYDRSRIACWPVDLDGDGTDEYFCADLYLMEIDFVSYAWVENAEHKLIPSNIYNGRLDCGTGHVAFGTYAVVESPEYGVCIMSISPEYMDQDYGYSLMKVSNGRLVTVYSETIWNYDGPGGSEEPQELPSEEELKAYENRVNALLDTGYILVTTDRWGVMLKDVYDGDTGESVKIGEGDPYQVLVSLSGNVGAGPENIEDERRIRCVGALRYRFKAEPYNGES